jgi:hypothetical protein
MQQHPAVHKQLLELARASKILGLRLLVAGAVSSALPDETESRRMTASGQFGQRRWPTAVGRTETFANGGVDPDLPFNFPEADTRSIPICREKRLIDGVTCWSARCSSYRGIASPSAAAVLRLMTSSNLVGSSIGRSAGFSLLRIRLASMPTKQYASASLAPPAAKTDGELP